MKKVILAAISFDRLQEALHKAKEQPFVVFGSLDGDVLAPLGQSGPGGAGDIPVYFYNYD
ncbi:MAG: hypothetical protein K6T29_03815 [Peptococcaceae bacterium]|nr:hypothetical protein [Peptococcaceae bacterium]